MGKANEKYDANGREKVECQICGLWYHRLYTHIEKQHDITKEEYKERFPGAKLFSEYAAEIAHKPREKNVVGDIKEAYKESEKEDRVEDENVLKIGAARLYVREDLEEKDMPYVPKNDPNWIFGKTEMERWEDVAIGIEDNEPIFIGGPTGCGKTAGILELAAALNQPVRRVQLNRDFKAADFLGRANLEIDENGNQVTRHKDGVATEAVRYGHWLLLDEVDQAHPDVMMVLQALLEGSPLVLTGNFGEVVERHPNFRIIATANTFGRGDESGLYAGAKTQNEATLDRYGVVIRADYPEKNTEADILVKRTGINKDIAKKMVSVAHKVRKALEEEDINCTFSTRRLIGWSKKTVRYDGDVRRAASVAILNKLDTEDARFVEDLIQRYFGGEVA